MRFVSAHRGRGAPNGRPTRFPAAAVVMLAALGLVGCAPKRGGPVPYNVQNFGQPDDPAKVDFTQVYRVGPGDVLNVTVYRVPNLSGDVTVDATGNILMPLIGTVPVQGQSSTDIAAELTRRLGDKYLQSPEVQVAVKASERQRITVDGSVEQPGIFPIAGTTTLIQAVALAKGPDEDANPRRVVVFRTISGQRMAAAFDLTDIRRGLEPDPVIYGNDIIVVDGTAARSNMRDLISMVPLVALFRPF